MGVTSTELREAIQHRGLSGRAVCVHASLRSFGHVDGGAGAILDAFLAEAATLLVPSFSWDFSVTPRADDRPDRNGTRYDYPHRPAAGPPYSSDSGVVDRDMGALSAALVAHPQRARGAHPLCSFSAVGPSASDLLASQGPTAVWAPLERLVQEEGFVVLMGVGLNRLTIGHLADVRAGRRSFVRWALDDHGEASRVDVGGCSEGFAGLEPALHATSSAKVGTSRWTVLPARQSLEGMTSLIRQDPTVTCCDDEQCERCIDAIAGGPVG